MAITVYTYNDKVLKNVSTGKWLKKVVDPYNPLGLPAKTIRIRTTDDVELTPGNPGSMGGATVKQVVAPHVYDIEFTYTHRGNLKNYVGGSKVLEILGFNTEGMEALDNLFYDLTAITTVPLFDTSSVTDMNHMFDGCSSLTSIPLFDTSSVTDMDYMFKNCVNVESGALALYQQASGQTTPPSNHTGTFTDCGSNTVTGAAELAQIPSSWGGTAA